MVYPTHLKFMVNLGWWIVLLTCLQVRLRYGPELKDIAPQYAKQFEQARP